MKLRTALFTLALVLGTAAVFMGAASAPEADAQRAGSFCPIGEPCRHGELAASGNGWERHVRSWQLALAQSLVRVEHQLRGAVGYTPY